MKRKEKEATSMNPIQIAQITLALENQFAMIVCVGRSSPKQDILT